MKDRRKQKDEGLKGIRKGGKKSGINKNVGKRLQRTHRKKKGKQGKEEESGRMKKGQTG